MEPPFLKIDYVRTGQTYGKGVAQAIDGLQEELNEITNQRMDNVSLILNKMIAVIEKYLVDADVVSQPGGMIRFRGNSDTDINKIFKTIEFGDVTNSSYKETFEKEREIQEVSAANRVTTGGAGLVNDQNSTLGGMELLRQAAYDRFTIYAYLIGKTVIQKAAKMLMSLSYQNRTPESRRRILGAQPIEILPGQIVPKHAAFKLLPPHEIELDYDFVFTDIFSEENKMAESTQLANFAQLAAGLKPALNPDPILKMIGSKQGMSPDQLTEVLGPGGVQMPTPLAQGMGQPSMPKLNKFNTQNSPSPTGPNLGSPTEPLNG
jgi:hypothetical protein